MDGRRSLSRRNRAGARPLGCNRCSAVAQGYAALDGAIKPCPRGTFKNSLGNSSCSSCPNSTTTIVASGATALSDCSACVPGWGSAAGVDPANPTCAVCGSGYYAFGYNQAGSACLPCEAGYVSRLVRGRYENKEGQKSAGSQGAGPGRRKRGSPGSHGGGGRERLEERACWAAGQPHTSLSFATC